ncbi:MAG: hypothetical protein JOZ13_06800 [Alphaproteobacteria bacterium]|nr:hypothetical protein [Alphaproteobacteria bacterium]
MMIDPIPVTAAEFADYTAEMVTALADAARRLDMPELAERLNAAGQAATQAQAAARRMLN